MPGKTPINRWAPQSGGSQRKPPRRHPMQTREKTLPAWAGERSRSTPRQDEAAVRIGWPRTSEYRFLQCWGHAPVRYAIQRDVAEWGLRRQHELLRSLDSPQDEPAMSGDAVTRLE